MTITNIPKTPAEKDLHLAKAAPFAKKGASGEYNVTHIRVTVHRGDGGHQVDEVDTIACGVVTEIEGFVKAINGQDDGSGDPRPGDIARIEPNVAGTAGKRAVKSSKKPGPDSVDSAAVEGVSDIRIIVSSDTELQDVELPERCRVVKLANSVTFDRMDRAIDALERLVTQPSSDAPSAALALPLAQTLLAIKPLQASTPLPPDFSFKDECLNESQQEAVKFALRSPEIALIHGPPGTGKTQTLVEIIRQFVAQNKRVLSISSTDNLLERLVPHEIPLTRIGHPARVMGNLHHETLDAQAARSDQAALAADVKSELESAMSSLAGKGKGRLKGAERKKMWEEVKELRKEYRKRERVVVQSVLSEAKIVLATCHSAGSRQLANMQFDVVCIDEACQALEA
ncbi:hypothetical protein FRC09_016648, partial [Ceratobasidium sp. 395]